MTWRTDHPTRRAPLLGWAAVNALTLNTLDITPPSAVPARWLRFCWLRLLVQDLPSPGRALLAVGAVFVLLATTGWTANRYSGQPGDLKATALAAWRHGSVHDHRLPEPTAPPSTVAHFFATLTMRQRIRLAERYPLIVGNLDGAPARVRYRANRISLKRAITAERHRRRIADFTVAGEWQSRRRVHRLRTLLDKKRHILMFDPTGRGMAAEVIGDLTKARRVSVVVPGVDTDLLSFEHTRKPRTSPVGMARALYSAARRADPGTPVAVVAWVGYRTPVGIGMDAATGGLATEGARRLRRLVEALPTHVKTALFCHSYGSVVCGVAAPDLPRGKTADIAVFGSPGMRADRVRDLHTHARVWAARDRGDWIEDVPHLEIAGLGHGQDPVAPEFGARVIATDRARGHSGYFTPGTTSLRNFAQIALGHFNKISCATGRRCTRGLG